MINEPIPLDYYQLKMQFTFILFDSVLYNFMGFDKCINRVQLLQYITQKTLLLLKTILCASSNQTSPVPLIYGNYPSSYSLSSFVFSRKSYSWNHTTCHLFRITFSQYVFKIHLCLLWPNSSLCFFFHWIILYIDIYDCLLTYSPVEGHLSCLNFCQYWKKLL